MPAPHNLRSLYFYRLFYQYWHWVPEVEILSDRIIPIDETKHPAFKLLRERLAHYLTEVEMRYVDDFNKILDSNYDTSCYVNIVAGFQFLTKQAKFSNVQIGFFSQNLLKSISTQRWSPLWM